MTASIVHMWLHAIIAPSGEPKSKARASDSRPGARCLGWQVDDSFNRFCQWGFFASESFSCRGPNVSPKCYRPANVAKIETAPMIAIDNGKIR